MKKIFNEYENMYKVFPESTNLKLGSIIFYAT